ncbi:hypothetical protein ACLI1V_17255, partial [Enterococcus faecalis]
MRARYLPVIPGARAFPELNLRTYVTYEKMRGQIRGLEMASKNSQDGISLIQTAEGALTETHAILQRVRELVVQAGNTGTQDKATDLQS